MSLDVQAFWRRLDDRRRACGLSGRRLCALAGLAHSWWRDGQRKQFAVKLDALYALARALRCRPADLLPPPAEDAP